MDYSHYETVLKFGKHYGKTLKQVYESPKGLQYLLWAHSKGVIKLSDYLYDKFTSEREEELDDLVPDLTHWKDY